MSATLTEKNAIIVANDETLATVSSFPRGSKSAAAVRTTNDAIQGVFRFGKTGPISYDY